MNIILQFRPLAANDLSIVLRWRYPAPYDIYNFNPDAALEIRDCLLMPAHRYHALDDELGSLVGFAGFGPDGRVAGYDYDENTLDLSLGMAPEFTGRGLGAKVVDQVVDFAVAQFAPQRLRVTIAAFNLRAQKVWLANGFVEVDRFHRQGDNMQFVVLERKAG